MENFATLGLPEVLLNTLTTLGYNTPTPIQAGAIPSALEGRDILGSAQTGTGKTAAFGIPVAAKLMLDPNATALIMTPTRELAMQVGKNLDMLVGKSSKIKSALLIGGDSMMKQLAQLRNNPRLIVGTPGRINDHLLRKTLKLDNCQFLVLDEMDRMLDMGFSIQIDQIVSFLPQKRQTMMFTATMPKAVVKLSKQYLNDPFEIFIGSSSKPSDNIVQENKFVQESEKYSTLCDELNTREGSVIVFVKTKMGADKLANNLSKDGHDAEAVHGDLRQHKRERVVYAFRKSKFRVLVATDVAARGLDIPHIEHVINYDLPQCAEDYIHRIGRTGRAGAKGHSLSLVSNADRGKYRDIQRLINPDSKEEFEPKFAKNGRRVRDNYDNRRGGGDRRPKGRSDRDRGFGGNGERDRGFGGNGERDRGFGGQKERSNFGFDRSEGGERSFFGEKKSRPKFEGNDRRSDDRKFEGRKSGNRDFDGKSSSKSGFGKSFGNKSGGGAFGAPRNSSRSKKTSN